MKWLSAFYVVWFAGVIFVVVTRFSSGLSFSVVFSIVASPLLFVSCRRQSRQAHLHARAHDREPTGFADLVRRLRTMPSKELQ